MRLVVSAAYIFLLPQPLLIFMKQFVSFFCDNVSSISLLQSSAAMLISLVSLFSCTWPCSSCASFKAVLDLPNVHVCPCIILRLTSFLLLGPGHVVPTHTST